MNIKISVVVIMYVISLTVSTYVSDVQAAVEPMLKKINRNPRHIELPSRQPNIEQMLRRLSMQGPLIKDKKKRAAILNKLRAKIGAALIRKKTNVKFGVKKHKFL